MQRYVPLHERLLPLARNALYAQLLAEAIELEEEYESGYRLVSLKLPPSLLERLNRLSEATGVPRSRLLRIGLRLLLMLLEEDEGDGARA